MKPTGNAKTFADLFARASASHRAGRLKEVSEVQQACRSLAVF
jgi:hypothetical protein